MQISSILPDGEMTIDFSEKLQDITFYEPAINLTVLNENRFNVLDVNYFS
jgi:hypothetical protein